MGRSTYAAPTSRVVRSELAKRWYTMGTPKRSASLRTKSMERVSSAPTSATRRGGCASPSAQGSARRRQISCGCSAGLACSAAWMRRAKSSGDSGHWLVITVSASFSVAAPRLRWMTRGCACLRSFFDDRTSTVSTASSLPSSHSRNQPLECISDACRPSTRSLTARSRASNSSSMTEPLMRETLARSTRVTIFGVFKG